MQQLSGPLGPKRLHEHSSILNEPLILQGSLQEACQAVLPLEVLNLFHYVSLASFDYDI